MGHSCHGAPTLKPNAHPSGPSMVSCLPPMNPHCPVHPTLKPNAHPSGTILGAHLVGIFARRFFAPSRDPFLCSLHPSHAPLRTFVMPPCRLDMSPVPFSSSVPPPRVPCQARLSCNPNPINPLFCPPCVSKISSTTLQCNMFYSRRVSLPSLIRPFIAARVQGIAR